jgi:outer membrane PBP1 activator LpoA protein
MIELKFTFTSASKTAARTFSVALLAVLASCTTQGPVTRPTDVQALEARARAAEQSGNLAAAADAYAELAAGVTGTLRTGYLLESARLLATEGDAALARRRILDARNGASAEQQKTITVLLARLEVRDRRPQAALDLLAGLQPPLPAPVQSEAAAVRGQALFQLGRHVEAVRTLVDREVWLENGNDILANQRLIWEGFRAFPPRDALAPTGDRVVDGWLALAPLATRSDSDLRRELLAWRQTYTDHPAAGRLLADMLSTQRGAAFPTQVALLLPLSSPQRTQALAIRDGFMAAHLARGGDHATTIRVYDTTQLGSQQAYLRAQLDGADFIVGPLFRAEVDQVIAQAGFVPTLALNFAQAETPSLGSFYQFALAPTDEARVIAASAAQAGAATAIAFVPSNQRGYGILDSFRAEFEAQGGRVLDFAGYDPASRDFAQQIAALFNITRSTQRHRRLAANLGVPIEFEPRLRQDVDAIFIAADSRTARLLMPQLRTYAVGNIPTYATSEIYNPGSNTRDNDLNGLIFADVPAVLTPDDDAELLRRDVQSYWPQRATEIRLYGMGYDAYELIAPLYTADRTWPVRGLSGELSPDEHGRIRRNLPLAQIRNGRPVALEPPAGAARQSSELVGSR